MLYFFVVLCSGSKHSAQRIIIYRSYTGKLKTHEIEICVEASARFDLNTHTAYWYSPFMQTSNLLVIYIDCTFSINLDTDCKTRVWEWLLFLTLTSSSYSAIWERLYQGSFELVRMVSRSDRTCDCTYYLPGFLRHLSSRRFSQGSSGIQTKHRNVVGTLCGFYAFLNVVWEEALDEKATDGNSK